MNIFTARFSIDFINEGAWIKINSPFTLSFNNSKLPDIHYFFNTTDLIQATNDLAAHIKSFINDISVIVIGNEIILRIREQDVIENPCSKDYIPINIEYDNLKISFIKDTYWLCEDLECSSCCPEFNCDGCGELIIKNNSPYLYVDSPNIMGCGDAFRFDAGVSICPIIKNIINEAVENYLRTGGLDVNLVTYQSIAGWQVLKNNLINYDIGNLPKVLVIEFRRTELGDGSNVSILIYVDTPYLNSENFYVSHIKYKAWYVQNKYPNVALYPTIHFVSFEAFVNPPPNSKEIDIEHCFPESHLVNFIPINFNINFEVYPNYCCQTKDIYYEVLNHVEKTKLDSELIDVVIEKNACNILESEFIVNIYGCGKTYTYTIPIVKPGYLTQSTLENLLLLKESEYYESVRDCDSCCPPIPLLDPCYCNSSTLDMDSDDLPFKFTVTNFDCDNSIFNYLIQIKDTSIDYDFLLDIFEITPNGEEQIMSEILISNEIELFLKIEVPYRFYIKGIDENLEVVYRYEKNLFVSFPILNVCEDLTIYHENCENYNDGKIDIQIRPNVNYYLYRIIEGEEPEYIGASQNYKNLSPGRYKIVSTATGYCAGECIFEINKYLGPEIQIQDLSSFTCSPEEKTVEIKVVNADTTCKQCYEGVSISIDNQEYINLDSTNIYITNLKLGIHEIKIKDCSCCITRKRINIKEKAVNLI